MQKRQYKIKSFINNLENNKHWYIISIVYDSATYFRRLNNINDLYIRISNSKSSITGQINNRSWWKKIVPSGIYQTILTEENLILNFLMTTDIKMNELEFKSRVKKICPYVSIKICYQEKEELDKLSSSNYFSYRQNIELFGEAKKEKFTI
jgi:hypothetical protein